MSEETTADDVVTALHKRFSPPEFQGFEEAPTFPLDHTKSRRLIDFVGVGMWHSDGHPIHAVEVKVDRTDWMDELENPGKHAWWEDNADYFWIAAAPGVVKKREVPDDWGYLKLHGDVLHRKVAAPKDSAPFDEITRRLFTQLLKKKGEASQARLRREYERGIKKGKKEKQREHEQERFQVERDHADAEAFMKALRDEGVRVHQYNAGPVAEHVAPFFHALKAGDDLLRPVREAQERAEDIADSLEDALEEVEA